MGLTPQGLSEAGKCVEDRFTKEAARSAPPLCPPQNKRSLRTEGWGMEGADGREVVLKSRENAFLGMEEHPGSFSETERYLSLAKETAFAAPLLPIWKDPVPACTPCLSGPVWGRRTSHGAVILSGDTVGRSWREGERCGAVHGPRAPPLSPRPRRGRTTILSRLSPGPLLPSLLPLPHSLWPPPSFTWSSSCPGHQ